MAELSQNIANFLEAVGGEPVHPENRVTILPIRPEPRVPRREAPQDLVPHPARPGMAAPAVMVTRQRAEEIMQEQGWTREERAAWWAEQLRRGRGRPIRPEPRPPGWRPVVHRTWSELEKAVRARIRAELNIHPYGGLRLTDEQRHTISRIFLEELRRVRTPRVRTDGKPIRLREQRRLILPAGARIVHGGREVALPSESLAILPANAIIQTPLGAFVHTVGEEDT